MLQGIENMPISRIEWLPVDSLAANSYNPNVVMNAEMHLLRTSLLESGWIQPLLVCQDGMIEAPAPASVSTPAPRVRVRPGLVTPTPAVAPLEIIDGFHRATLAKTDKDIRAMTGGLVPCARMYLTRGERMMLTVRINRAKGSHIALKMHELVRELVQDLHIPVEDVCKGLGATKHEVETLLVDDLFKKFDVDNAKYSQAWVPKQK